MIIRNIFTSFFWWIILILIVSIIVSFGLSHKYSNLAYHHSIDCNKFEFVVSTVISSDVLSINNTGYICSIFNPSKSKVGIGVHIGSGLILTSYGVVEDCNEDFMINRYCFANKVKEDKSLGLALIRISGKDLIIFCGNVIQGFKNNFNYDEAVTVVNIVDPNNSVAYYLTAFNFSPEVTMEGFLCGDGGGWDFREGTCILSSPDNCLVGIVISVLKSNGKFIITNHENIRKFIMGVYEKE